MNSERIFFGDIYKVTEYEAEPISNDPKISRIKKKKRTTKKTSCFTSNKRSKISRFRTNELFTLVASKLSYSFYGKTSFKNFTSYERSSIY